MNDDLIYIETFKQQLLCGNLILTILFKQQSIFITRMYREFFVFIYINYKSERDNCVKILLF